MRPTVLQLIARVSSRVFLAITELCRNEAWFDITKNCTLDGFTARGPTPSIIPPSSTIRPPVPARLPVCAQGVRDSRHRIQLIVDRRYALKAQALAEGRPEPEYLDVTE
ncbi:hypothetical protein CTA2_3804 [Colletotrichum tanaceti]|uniref:Uncharacterized protein n=1 Tax=Colletotrichum tanaceti TaxID=1306861 RepID=A0A4U6X525_9PEZI|nr:hypothetical protein CTA2_3804 [Colletotrichum tanaceti]TKW50512.1 hypothetical protein CTA1_12565 [Colletotrichum tanaceti]